MSYTELQFLVSRKCTSIIVIPHDYNERHLKGVEETYEYDQNTKIIA